MLNMLKNLFGFDRLGNDDSPNANDVSKIAEEMSDLASYAMSTKTIRAIGESITSSRLILLSASSSFLEDERFGGAKLRQRLIRVIEKEIEMLSNLSNMVARVHEIDEIIAESNAYHEYYDKEVAPLLQKTATKEDATDDIGEGKMS